jgi:hypothetical protein
VDDPDTEQKMYLHVYTGIEQVRSPARLDPIIEFVACAPGDFIQLIPEIRRFAGSPLTSRPAMPILVTAAVLHPLKPRLRSCALQR